VETTGFWAIFEKYSSFFEPKTQVSKIFSKKSLQSIFEWCKSTADYFSLNNIIHETLSTSSSVSFIQDVDCFSVSFNAK